MGIAELQVLAIEYTQLQLKYDMLPSCFGVCIYKTFYPPLLQGGQETNKSMAISRERRRHHIFFQFQSIYCFT